MAFVFATNVSQTKSNQFLTSQNHFFVSRYHINVLICRTGCVMLYWQLIVQCSETSESMSAWIIDKAHSSLTEKWLILTDGTKRNVNICVKVNCWLNNARLLHNLWLEGKRLHEQSLSIRWRKKYNVHKTKGGPKKWQVNISVISQHQWDWRAETFRSKF